MDQRNKNILIGGLLAIVLVMAVGYAAFATQLNINGTAQITSSWDVHYALPTGATENTLCTLNTAGAAASTCGMTVTTGTLQGGGAATTAPTGTIKYESGLLTATLGATLLQPGDTVQYVLTPHNYGTGLAAVADDPIIKIAAGNDASSATALESGNSLQVGQIKWTVSFTKKPSVAAGEDDNAITVTAEYVQPDANTVVETQSASVNVAIVYRQA